MNEIREFELASERPMSDKLLWQLAKQEEAHWAEVRRYWAEHIEEDALNCETVEEGQNLVRKLTDWAAPFSVPSGIHINLCFMFDRLRQKEKATP